MKPQLGMVRKQEMEFGGESGRAVGTVTARENGVADSPTSVSYTHLDVYKRQALSISLTTVAAASAPFV